MIFKLRAILEGHCFVFFLKIYMKKIQKNQVKSQELFFRFWVFSSELSSFIKVSTRNDDFFLKSDDLYFEKFAGPRKRRTDFTPSFDAGLLIL